MEAVKKMLQFIFKVRCNLFHGSKSTTQVAEDEQIERMKIYTAILLGVNDLLFMAVEANEAIIGWRQDMAVMSNQWIESQRAKKAERNNEIKS